MVPLGEVAWGPRAGRAADSRGAGARRMSLVRRLWMGGVAGEAGERSRPVTAAVVAAFRRGLNARGRRSRRRTALRRPRCDRRRRQRRGAPRDARVRVRRGVRRARVPATGEDLPGGGARKQRRASSTTRRRREVRSPPFVPHDVPLLGDLRASPGATTTSARPRRSGLRHRCRAPDLRRGAGGAGGVDHPECHLSEGVLCSRREARLPARRPRAAQRRGAGAGGRPPARGVRGHRPRALFAASGG